ncbi:MAG TPA: protein translocase subunit SecD [Persephonella sp.]|uniref:Protein translocase subunit SecD n=1 Tax=Persephonella marina (strain DSM 14350 / EX-H1) TaxID=123214 RepID=C0QRM6_PERMH|nr:MULTISPECIES: protein translocase subunit SecD [Persephonella]ACO04519.1 protein-export membrane protein SecD [Persephonella marina EX-H1]HCB69068.1 protein translocase subunit SecD [Persephonella sp.]
MKEDIKLKLVVVFAILVASLYFIFTKPIKLGLDLQGGMSIVLEVDVDHVINTQYKQLVRDIEKKLKDNGIEVLSGKVVNGKAVVSLLDPTTVNRALKIIKDEFPQVKVETENGNLVVQLLPWELDRIKKMTVQQAVETLRNRIDEFGTLNPNIAKMGERRILVELPGVVDPERAKSIIGKTAQLELLEVVDTAFSKEELLKKYPDGLPEGTKILEGPEEHINGQTVKEWFLVKDTPIVTGSMLKDARTTIDQSGKPAVNFELTSEGAEIFGEATAKMIGKRLAIVLDNKVISAPVVRSRISSAGQITGNFTPEEAADLAIVLRAGALPAPVHILEERVIGPTLGKDSIEKTVNAGIAALVLVGLFMLWRYAVSGFISIVALIFNGILLWAVMVFLDVTLTLPGIAGIILNIGMAVDANVIIFERIKEEMKRGRTLRVAVEEGFKRAWDAILDAQITTLIAAFVLFQFGTGPLKGFAATLSIGTITSIFTALFVTKLFLDIVLGGRKSLKYAF